MLDSLRPSRSEPAPSNLQHAFRLCDRITREHSKSFFFSTAFLPSAKRRAIRAFYAFCRRTDDIVDVMPLRSAETLAQWRAAAQRPANEQTDPVLLAWATVRQQFDVPQRYIEELVDGCEMDLTINRYATWEQLRRYCYCVASTVGLISMHIIGLRPDASRERAMALAEDLGVALQLTNILRDVGEDIGRGRIYLPQEDLARFHYSDDDVRHGVIDGRFRALLRFEMDRADALYDRSCSGIPLLSSDGRLAVSAAATLYRGILGKIHLNDYDVYNRRAYLSQTEKMQRLPGIYLNVMRMGDG
ncbi:MAG: phytoene/squalene synthase family protein [Chloroflexi bacterium]|nr:phytoene/squalene synthase family protein [Chloroflexota bacterium]